MNRFIQRIEKVFDKNWRTLFLSQYGVYNKMEDTPFLQMIFKASTGKDLNLENPQTFNEKLQWLKIYDRKPQYTIMVDKYAVKGYVADIIGAEYIIPTLGVWNCFDEIDFSVLPEQFVLKCTHDSGGIVICKDKSTFDVKAARKKLNFFMKRNYFAQNREWPYKNVPHRIIAEQYMVDNAVSELRDYKFFCFGGVCKCMKVDFDRFVEHRANYYDVRGNLLNLGETICPPDPQKNIVLPANMDKMIVFAEKLSQEMPFLRVDFYDVNGKIYFGELTFYPASGFGTFINDEWDAKLGEWIELSETHGEYLLLAKEFIIRLQMKNESGELKDYKIHCFNGEPKLTLVCSDRFSPTGLREDFFDENWCHLPIKRPNHPNSDTSINKPINFERMKEFAGVLSKGIPFVRVDFYEINGQLYFGELTFFPASGFVNFEPDKWNFELGRWLELPECEYEYEKTKNAYGNKYP